MAYAELVRSCVSGRLHGHFDSFNENEAMEDFILYIVMVFNIH